MKPPLVHWGILPDYLYIYIYICICFSFHVTKGIKTRPPSTIIHHWHPGAASANRPGKHGFPSQRPCRTALVLTVFLWSLVYKPTQLPIHQDLALQNHMSNICWFLMVLMFPVQTILSHQVRLSQPENPHPVMAIAWPLSTFRRQVNLLADFIHLEFRHDHSMDEDSEVTTCLGVDATGERTCRGTVSRGTTRETGPVWEFWHGERCGKVLGKTILEHNVRWLHWVHQI